MTTAERFLHELALALGGMTVAELKGRMSTAELGAWMAYVQEMGPLSLAWRIDYAVARGVAPFIGGPDAIRKLVPWPKEHDRDATLEDVMAMLGNAAKSQERA